MCSEQINFIGYHGTSSEAYNKIREFGFNKSRGGWLGSGVYFYEENKEMSLDWARYKYTNKRITSIKCNISVFKDRVLDVSNPQSECNKKVQNFRKELLNRGIKERTLIDFQDEEIDCKILNFICTKDGYDIVRNFTYTYKDFDRKLGNKRSNICNGIELCVRECKCINLK